MLTARIQQTLDEAGLPGGVRHVAVAASGGADSCAAALALHRLWSPRGIRLTLVHVDHGLRPGEDDADTAFVRAFAARLGAGFALRAVDVRAAADATGDSPEMAARTLRHAALRDAARDAGADAIAFGHNADDQLETLLLRLGRGAGPRGLGGMAPVEPGAPATFRPLLDCARDDIRAWLRAEGVAWREDSSNDADDALRNRVRHHVVPELLRALGPAARDAALRTMALLRDEERLWLRPLAASALDAATLPDGTLRAGALPALPRPLARRVALGFLQAAGLPPAAQTHAVVERLLALADGPDAGTRALDLGAGFRAVRAYGAVRVVRDGGAAQPAAGDPLSHLRAEAARGALRPRRDDPLRRPAAASVSRAAVPDPLRLRVRRIRAGDRMRPFGAAGSRTLADILVDRKIPRAARSAVEVVCLGERIVWLPGHAVDAAFAVEASDAPSWRLSLAAATAGEGSP